MSNFSDIVGFQDIHSIISGETKDRYFVATKNGKPLLLKNSNKVEETRRNKLLVVKATDKADAYIQIADILTYQKIKMDDILEIDL